jgi:hypothetical protein
MRGELTMIKTESEFKSYAEALPEEEKALLAEYLSRLSQHISLPKKQKRDMLEDFERALLHYAARGCLWRPLGRLDSLNMGGLLCQAAHIVVPSGRRRENIPMSMKRHQIGRIQASVYRRRI